MSSEVPEGSVPLGCPKCGGTEIDQHYMALTSTTNEYFEAPDGKVYCVEGELELVNPRVEEFGLNCVACGHELKSQRKLKRS